MRSEGSRISHKSEMTHLRSIVPRRNQTAQHEIRLDSELKQAGSLWSTTLSLQKPSRNRVASELVHRSDVHRSYLPDLMSPIACPPSYVQRSYVDRSHVQASYVHRSPLYPPVLGALIAEEVVPLAPVAPDLALADAADLLAPLPRAFSLVTFRADDAAPVLASADGAVYEVVRLEAGVVFSHFGIVDTKKYCTEGKCPGTTLGGGMGHVRVEGSMGCAGLGATATTGGHRDSHAGDKNHEARHARARSGPSCPFSSWE